MTELLNMSQMNMSLNHRREKSPIIKKITLSYDPQIVRSHPFYSSADASEHLSQN